MRRLAVLIAGATILAIALFASATLNDSGIAIAQEPTCLPVQRAATPDPNESVAATAPSSGGFSVSQTHRETYSARWGIERIGAPASWDAARFHPVLVAVLDTGIASDSLFADRVLAGVDLSGSGTTEDEHGHGTHMADTIAAIAPNASFLNVKVADRRGRCDTATVAQGIRWATDRGALIINISLEVSSSPELASAVNYAWERGAVIIAAAGNSGTSEHAYPAAYPQTIAVAGTNESDGLAVLSNHGDWVDIAAPGFKILAEIPGGGLGYETGTSPAAAHVSGVAALLLGITTDASEHRVLNDDVRSILESTAQPLSIIGAGKGLVDAHAAVLSLSA